MASLDQVVTQDEVLGEGAFQHFLEYLEVINALAAERALVEDVLIQLKGGSGVDIETAQTGKQLGVTRLVGDLDIDIHAGLHDAVTCIDALAVGSQLGTVQGMRHGTY